MNRWSEFELAWARAALAAIFPGSRESGLAGIAEMDVGRHLSDVRRHAPRRAAAALRLAVWLVALAPLFTIGRFTTIVRLKMAERERVLARLVASPIYAVRQLTLVLKTTGALLYAAAPAVRARMRGPASAPMKKSRLPLAPNARVPA
jgi:hypothetical protein